MAETSHARIRRASVLGLILQIVAAGVAMGLFFATYAASFQQLAWYIAGGIPIWFVTLLVFRQHELAALEAMDLEQLRREKATSGGGEAMFSEEGGGPGFLVAQARLEWMQAWLVPIFGLLSALLLIVIGATNGWVVWNAIGDASSDLKLGGLRRIDVGLISLSVLMLFLFFCARYAAGLSKIAGWQLIRGCGSFMLGNAIAAITIVISLGVFLYQHNVIWENYVALAIPALMVLLGAETFLNFVLDIYRPRAPGTEPRACFDSRLLGLISEPGGLAHSLNEAINYQFGFQVSETWFYQLVQRTLLRLIWVGALAVWLLTCVVIVRPHERAIVEVFGEQINPAEPLTPGLHFKWPAPFARAWKYNTDQFHSFYVGFETGYESKQTADDNDRRRFRVELWTDDKHLGRKHFNFMIAPPPPTEQGDEADRQRGVERGDDESSEQDGRSQPAPVNLIRMYALVQYRIRPEQLDRFTQNAQDPHEIIRRVAWNELVRYNASRHIDELMASRRPEIGTTLRKRIAERVADFGIEVVYVGVPQLHPVKQVAEQYRSYVNAQQEMVSKIRSARVEESKILAEVAGDERRAIALATALQGINRSEEKRAIANEQLSGTQPAVSAETYELFDGLRPVFLAWIEAQARADRLQQRSERVREEFELGLGHSLREVERSAAEADTATEAAAKARTTLERESDALWRNLRTTYGRVIGDVLFDHAEARYALAFWNEQVERNLVGLEGSAAVILAQAQAERWQKEARAESQFTQLKSERVAYHAAPEIYRTRSFLNAWVAGLSRARKYLLTFDPSDRDVKIRFEAQEQARPDLVGTVTEVH